MIKHPTNKMDQGKQLVSDKILNKNIYKFI